MIAYMPARMAERPSESVLLSLQSQTVPIIPVVIASLADPRNKRIGEGFNRNLISSLLRGRDGYALIQDVDYAHLFHDNVRLCIGVLEACETLRVIGLRRDRDNRPGHVVLTAIVGRCSDLARLTYEFAGLACYCKAVFRQLNGAIRYLDDTIRIAKAAI